MLKIFLAEDEVIVRETIKRMIPWEELGFELVGWIDACKAGKERTSRT